MDFFMDPNDLPDHVKEELDKRAMEVDIIKHDIERLIDELDKDQLVTLRYLLHNSGGNEAYAAYMTGTIGGTLKYKFGVCGCGKNHDKDLLDTPGEVPVVSSTTPPAPAPGPDMDAEAARWEVYFITDDHTASGKVKCSGCDTEFHSLDDRMLRDPGVKGCESCQHKQKWG